MAREYTLASAGCEDFVRPMERLMQMVHERWNHVVHTDAWSVRNGEAVRYGGYAGCAEWPNDQGFPALTTELKRCDPLWRSSAAGIPVELRRWDNFEDWDLGTPFGIQHDVRLNYLSDLVHSVRKRYVEELVPDGCSGFTFVEHSQVPKLVSNPSHLPLKFYDERQLTTVDHFDAGASTAVLSTIGHRLAMPIAGQGLLSMVRVGASVVAASPPTAKVWNPHVPADTVSPGWWADGWRTPVRLQVCEDLNGLPGAVLGNGTSIMVMLPGLLGPRFFLHRPLILDHRLNYWLVVDLPLGLAGQSCTLALSDVPHADTPHQLKTWTGSEWVDHAKPSLQFSLHMPKFMWRSKQLWVRADRYKQQVHYRGLLHASRKTSIRGYCDFQPGPPAVSAEVPALLAMAKQKALLVGPGGSFVYPNIENAVGEGYRERTDVVTNYSDDDADYLDSAWWNYGSRRDIPGFLNVGGSPGLTAPPGEPMGLEQTNGMGIPNVGLTYLEVELHSNYRIARERKLLAWRAGTATCARFEYRTGLDEISSFMAVGAFNVGEEITLTGGMSAGGDRARIRVTAVNNAPGYPGTINSLEIVNRGRYLRLATPQNGPLEEWAEGGRSITLWLSVRVTEVVVVVAGSGYDTDCPVVLEPPVGGMGTFRHAVARGRRSNGGIDHVDILDPGSGYGDGGRGSSMERLRGTQESTDPAEITIWPGVRYFAQGTGIAKTTTGYEMVGDVSANTDVLVYNGVTYKAGQSFDGVAGVEDFTLIGAPVISAGIERWTHFYFGCPTGPKLQAWSGTWSFMMRATHGLPVGNAANLEPSVAKLGPGASMPVTEHYLALSSMQNNVDVTLPEIGIGFGWHLPMWGYCMWGIQDALIFGRPKWDINLDHQLEGGGGVAGTPGSPIPEGVGIIRVEVVDDRFRVVPEGDGEIIIDAFGEASLQDIQNAEGEAELDVDPDGEADASLPAVAEIEVDAEGEASQTTEPTGVAEIDVDTEGEASQMAAQDGEGEGEILVEGYGLPSRSFPDPVAFWDLEEVSGLRVDATGRGHDLDELTEVVFQTAGILGAAAQGTADTQEILETPDHADLRTPGTVAGWFRVDSGGGDYAILFSKGAEYGALYEAGGLTVNGVLTELAVPPTDTWFFLALRGDQASLNAGPWVACGAAGSGASAFRLLDNSMFHAAVAADQVGVWAEALQDDEVTWLYNNGAGRSFSSVTKLSVAYWKFEEHPKGSMVQLVDATSGGVDLTGTNGAPDEAGIRGRGLMCNTPYDGATYGADHVNLRAATQFSVAGWFKPDAFPSNGSDDTVGIVFKGANARGITEAQDEWGVFFTEVSGEPLLKFWVRKLNGAQGITVPLTGLANTWIFFCAVFDNGTLKLSVNNGTQVTAGLGDSPLLTSSGLEVGRPVTNYISTVIDELGKYPVALTPAQIAALYNNGDGLTYP